MGIIYAWASAESVLFDLELVNLDPFTETFSLDFYLEYLVEQEELCRMVKTVGGSVVGYFFGYVGIAEGELKGHVTAVSVSSHYRGRGIGRQLMLFMEEFVSAKTHACFVDLFVRPSNGKAVKFYRDLGYLVHQVIPRYYEGDQDAYDMRKILAWAGRSCRVSA